MPFLKKNNKKPPQNKATTKNQNKATKNKQQNNNKTTKNPPKQNQKPPAKQNQNPTPFMSSWGQELFIHVLIFFRSSVYIAKMLPSLGQLC